MIRIIFTYLLPLIAPFLIYGIYVRLSHRPHPEDALQTPWFWLIVTGLVLIIVALVATGLLTGSDPSGTYIPPRLEGGRIVPSEVR